MRFLKGNETRCFLFKVDNGISRDLEKPSAEMLWFSSPCQSIADFDKRFLSQVISRSRVADFAPDKGKYFSPELFSDGVMPLGLAFSYLHLLLLTSAMLE